MRILFNAHIATLNPAQPQATAMIIENGKIIAVGNDDELLAGLDATATRENMDGATIWPGLTDAHLHLQHYAEFLENIDCETDTRAECLHRVSERVQGLPANTWVRGHGWNQNLWPEGFGSAEDLDGVAPHNPVYLTAKSLHASWANTAALRLAGITASTPDPEGGVIGRKANGEPDGILYENAVRLVEQVIPRPSLSQISQSIEKAQSALWKMGLTGCHDFDYQPCFSALQLLNAEQKLKLRVIKSIPCDRLPDAIALGLRSGFGDDMLRIGAIKCFADGALGPRTAAMLMPYEGETANRGMALMDAEQIYELGQKAVGAGFALAIHAIGDLANHEVLNAYAHLRTFEKENHLPHFRHRIEHVQILHPDDLGRLAENDIIASMQPIHAVSDMYIADQHLGARAAFSYAWRAISDANTLLAFGSDAPVESPNPFFGIHAAVTRQRANGEPGPHGWYPEQRLSLQTALEAFTTGPAYTAGLEHKLGRLSPGYFADCIVLSQNPFTLPTSQLRDLAPTATMVNGEWVWQA